MRKKSDKPSTKVNNQCHICYKTVLGGSYNMKSHLYQHNITKPRFTCSYCSKEYFRKDVFEKHVRVHNGTQKTHQCDHCGRDFVDKRNLLVHLKIHDDNLMKGRIYSCEACGASYGEARLLKHHIRKEHSNLQQQHNINDKKPNETWVERVMKSKVWVKMTKVNHNVISIKKCDPIKLEHKNTDSNTCREYIYSVFAGKDQTQYSRAICDYCNKEMLKKSLQSHIRERHLKLKRFKCDNCERGFNRHYQLVDHNCGRFGRKKQNRAEN